MWHLTSCWKFPFTGLCQQSQIGLKIIPIQLLPVQAGCQDILSCLHYDVDKGRGAVEEWKSNPLSTRAAISTSVTYLPWKAVKYNEKMIQIFISHHVINVVSLVKLQRTPPIIPTDANENRGVVIWSAWWKSERWSTLGVGILFSFLSSFS